MSYETDICDKNRITFPWVAFTVHWSFHTLLIIALTVPDRKQY